MTIVYKVNSSESVTADDVKTLVKTETKEVITEKKFCIADIKREIEGIDAQIISLNERKVILESEINKIVTDLKLSIK